MEENSKRSKQQTNHAMLALDVGGATVDGGIVTPYGELIGTVKQIPSPTNDSAKTIISKFVTLLRSLNRQAERYNCSVTTCGIGIPGIFDYEHGISRQTHIFKLLFGKNLKEPLEQELSIPVFFLNDADAFALGVAWKEYLDEERLLVVTLGTGLGTTILKRGVLQPQPQHLGHISYRGRELEDFVSRRALESAYQENGGSRLEVVEIANKARHEDVAAKMAFSLFADALGEGLAIATASFQPTRIVCGGQISKAFDLFGKRAETVYARTSGSTIVFSVARSQHLALVGAAHHAMIKLNT